MRKAIFLVFSVLLFMNMEAQRDFSVIGHRGACGIAPENTLASIREAVNQQADMVEIDVHLTKDGELIVIHDHTLERTTNGTGEVKDHTLEELKKLDAGSWFDEKFAGEKLPTLDEVMDIVEGKSILLIEVKEGEAYYPGMSAALAKAIQQRNGHDWCIVQSFKQDVLDEVHRQDEKIELHRLLSIGSIPNLKGENADNWSHISQFNLYYKRTTKGTVKKLHKAGKKVFVWTVNDQKTFDKLKARGVDGIITNFPNLPMD